MAPVRGTHVARGVEDLGEARRDVAGLFGATYVDIATPFVGHEADYTYIASSGSDFNVHPTPAGYDAIQAQLVPEPSTLGMAGAGPLLVLGYARRRRRSAAA